MYIRVKRDRLTIFAQVGASDTIHKIKQSLFDSLVFTDQSSSDASRISGNCSESLATIYYDGTNVYARVQSADDIGLVHCQYSEEESKSVQEDHQHGTQRLTTTLLDDLKTLVDCKVENDDVVYIVLRRKDTGKLEDADPLVRRHDGGFPTTEDEEYHE